ncbi:MAG: hypothetical protein RMJ37_06005 [Spirochaetia bacterium]|nr:hypothetical protein [Spirochaetota bacterium]MCX8096579.1 hypothetical protein [Spirochaetota bacterium]MDW8112867.1 hypothetical protein [Spirochaetia bacterium]
MKKIKLEKVENNTLSANEKYGINVIATIIIRILDVNIIDDISICLDIFFLILATSRKKGTRAENNPRSNKDDNTDVIKSRSVLTNTVSLNIPKISKYKNIIVRLKTGLEMEIMLKVKEALKFLVIILYSTTKNTNLVIGTVMVIIPIEI